MAGNAQEWREETVRVAGTDLTLIQGGTGKPLLVLHEELGHPGWLRWHAALAQNRTLLIPLHPGFGKSPRMEWVQGVRDLAGFYARVVRERGLSPVDVIGFSLGGWIAAEIAVKSTARLSHLVLANAVGIKVADRETRDVVDIFAITDVEFNDLAYFDPSVGRRDYGAMPDAEVMIAARNREATGRFAWSPYMHNPKLKHRLARIRIPTLFLWGTNDRILSETYGRAYCAAVPGARFEPIERAGHFPHIEQPEAFARRIAAFTER